jgi:hypothetical protein
MRRKEMRIADVVSDPDRSQQDRDALVRFLTAKGPEAETLWKSLLDQALRLEEVGGDSSSAIKAVLSEIRRQFPAPPRPRRQAPFATFRAIGIFGNALVAGQRSKYADQVIFEFARVLSRFRCTLVHGPRAAGIETANIIQNHFRGRGVRSRLMFGNREPMVAASDAVFLIGGGPMAEAEAEIALRLDKPFYPVPRTTGAARLYSRRLRAKPDLQVGPGIAELLGTTNVDEVGDWLQKLLSGDWSDWEGSATG